MSAFEFVHAEKADYEVTELCRNLEVSTSGYYAWASRPASKRERDDERLRTKIRAAHERSRRTYGSPRIHAELQEDDEKVSRKRVARLMKEDGISAVQKRRFRRTTDSAHDLPVAIDRVEREFSATGPNQLWVGDITYVWTAEGKKECIHRLSFATRTEAYDAVADYIDNFYNPERRHSSLGQVSPVRFENHTSTAAQAA